MRIDIISVAPTLMTSYFQHSIMKRAQDKKIVNLHFHSLRDYTPYAHQQIDDYAYGGGAGMVLMIEPIYNIVQHLKQQRHYDDIIYFSPEGQLLDQKMSNKYALKDNLMLLCGHYKGIDQRVRDFLITQEISLGYFVLSGGEIPAMAFVDSVVRLIPGVLNDETSALFDSFQDDMIAPPVYTRPADFQGWQVPQVLLEGHHQRINDWKMALSTQKTDEFKKNLKKN